MSNIFGNVRNSQNQQPTSNLFTGFSNQTTSAPQTQPTQTSSLFDNSQQPTTSNLFGASKSDERVNPFGKLGDAPPLPDSSAGTLFGNVPSIGGLGSSAQQQTSGGGLGALSQTSRPAGSSLFASQAPQQQQPSQNGQQANGQPQGGLAKASQPAYFSNLLEKGRKRAHGDDEGGGFEDLPSLQFGLGDIARKVRELGGVGSQIQGSNAVDSKAHYLLAASGVNPSTTLRDLKSLNAQPSITSNSQPSTDWDPDTSKYVNQLQQQSTLKMIAEGIERAHRNFDTFLEENVDINWEVQRKKIYEHFGLVSRTNDRLDDFADSVNPAGSGSFGKSPRRGRSTNAGRAGQSTLNRSIFGKSSLQKSVIGTPGVGSGNAALFAQGAEKNGTGPVTQNDPFLREKELKFADRVQNLNYARMQGSDYPLLQEFSNVESQPGGESSSSLVDAYKALIEVTREDADPASSTGSKAAKERQLAEDYLDEVPNSARTIRIRKRIIDGSRRCLEKQFFDSVETLIARNPKEANLGGIPTAINKIRAYIRIRAARRDLTPDGTELQALNDDYCWALCFFLLRSGLVNEAAAYVNDNITSFRNLDRNFVTYISSYATSPDRRLPRPQQDRINTEYQQRSRNAPENSLDPYRMACYKIVGRCELSKRQVDIVSQGVEDWIWLQFNLAREVNRVEENAGDIFGLEELREAIREIGQRYFSKDSEGAGGSGYGTYFFLQILGGMYEQAVSYLYSYSYVSAVHFAIALDFYGLLRVSDFSASDSELLTYNTKELPQINFGRMLGYYTRDFRSGNVEAAVDYISLICLDADLPGAMGKAQSLLCHEALRELVLETREFAKLLGDIHSDGTRLKGAIEQRLRLIGLADQEEFLQTVTLQAASVADDNGRTTDAVLLYHLAEDYDNVIAIINRALSEAIAVELGQEQMRLQPLKPRTATQQQPNQQQQQIAGSSLSLTSVDDPAVLAKNMISVYNANALYYQKIRAINRDACGVLLRMSDAKGLVAAGQWAEALDTIDSLDLLPLHAHGSIPDIRAHVNAFNSLPQSISRNIGPLLMWAITCIGRQREVLMSGQFEDGTRKAMSEELLQGATDLMVFAGLVRYRLGERVWDAVTRCGGDVGVYA